MLHQVQSDEETTRSYPVSAMRIASIWRWL
jgi:hypothetical protein